MSENNIKNIFLGTSYEEEKFYIETTDINANINKILINNFIPDGEVQAKLENNDYVGFCFDCQENIKKGICENHSVKYYKDIINKINMNEIKEKFKNYVEDYNYVILELEQKIKNLKQRNNEQIKLIEKIIDIYDLSIKSNNITYQLLSNSQNILRFNNINDYKNDIDIFDYNILKPFSIENYLKEKVSIQNLQKITKLNFNLEKDELNSILYLEKINKVIAYSKFIIYLINPVDSSLGNKITTDRYIISLNLMKDKETILVSFENLIRKLTIKNNALLLEDYLKNVKIYEPGVIINYKNDIVWGCGAKIFYNKGHNIYYVFEETDEDYLEKKQDINIKNLYEYQDGILLYIYLYSDYGCGYESLHFNLYKEGNNNKNKDLIFENGNEDYIPDSLNNYKIFEHIKNEVIIVCKKEINIVNILKWEIIETIIPKEFERIYNSYSLNNSYYLFFLLSKSEKSNNMMIIKIKEKFYQIIFKNSLNTKENQDLYFINKNNELRTNSQLISVGKQEISFNQIIMDINKTFDLKNNDDDLKIFE